MIPFRLVVQTIALLGASWLLFVLWRAIARFSPRLRHIVAAGFLVRAFGAQILFWISYLRLPAGRSLQLDEGFWFFALDSLHYHSLAVETASRGIPAIVAMSNTEPSVSFIQTLSLAAFCFGSSPAVGVLLNLFSYLGTCYVIARWASKSPSGEKPALFAVAAISLSPAAILWTFQPLKDTVFAFLVVILVAACASWDQAWSSGRMSRSLRAAVIMIVASLFISGIRWYFTFASLLAMFFFFPMVIFGSRRRIAAVVSSLALFELMALSLAAGAGPYLPENLRGLILPAKVAASLATLPDYLAKSVEETRVGFEKTPGGTTIGEGKLLAAHPSHPHSVTTPAQPIEVPGGEASLPTSRARRLLAGCIALTVPHAISQPLGLLNIGGGKGMWLFSDLDTLEFDLVLVLAAIYIVRAVRTRGIRNPSLWLILAMTVILTLPLIYTVTNFGSLFRLRGLTYLLVALIPLMAFQPVRRDFESAEIVSIPSERGSLDG